jgi:hypothetical protein
VLLIRALAAHSAGWAFVHSAFVICLLAPLFFIVPPTCTGRATRAT